MWIVALFHDCCRRPTQWESSDTAIHARHGPSEFPADLRSSPPRMRHVSSWQSRVNSAAYQRKRRACGNVSECQTTFLTTADPRNVVYRLEVIEEMELAEGVEPPTL